MPSPITNAFPLHTARESMELGPPTAFPLLSKPGVRSLNSGPNDTSQPPDVAAPAREFEALLIGQMLRSAHSSEDPEDPTADTMWDMAAQQFSKVLADNGGLGLARIITQGLRPTVAPPPATTKDAESALAALVDK